MWTQIRFSIWSTLTCVHFVCIEVKPFVIAKNCHRVHATLRSTLDPPKCLHGNICVNPSICVGPVKAHPCFGSQSSYSFKTIQIGLILPSIILHRSENHYQQFICMGFVLVPVLGVLSSLAIILPLAIIFPFFNCVMAHFCGLCIFLMVPWVVLQSVIVAFSSHRLKSRLVRKGVCENSFRFSLT